MWSQRVRYAVRAVVLLSTRRHRRIPARELAEIGAIPAKYLEAVLADLRSAGIVDSTKGAGGGYTLSRDPAWIPLREVISAVDPDLFDAQQSRDDGAAHAPAAEDPTLGAVERTVIRMVSETTVGDAVMRWQQSQATIDYSI